MKRTTLEADFLRSLEPCYFRFTVFGVYIWVKKPFISNKILIELLQEEPLQEGWVAVGYWTGDIRKGQEKFFSYSKYVKPHILIG